METTRIFQERRHIALITCRIGWRRRGIRPISCDTSVYDVAWYANSDALYRDDAASPGSTLRRLWRKPQGSYRLRLLCVRRDIASVRCRIAWLRRDIVREKFASYRDDAASYAFVAAYP